MARRFSRGRGISQSQKRKKLWSPLSGQPTGEGLVNDNVNESVTLNFPVPADVAAPGAAAFGSLAFVFPTGNGDGDIPPESTLLRIRGTIKLDQNVAEDGATANDGIETHAFGIGVLESGAADLGAFPNPASPDGSAWDGWMFYRSLNAPVVDAAGSGMDVKSMRKIQSGYSLVLVYGVYKVGYDASEIVSI